MFGASLTWSFGEGDLQVVAGGRRVLDRHEAHVRAEDPGLDGDPLGLAALAVEVDVLDLADLVAVAVDERSSAPGLDVLECRHGRSFRSGGSLRRFPRSAPSMSACSMSSGDLASAR